MKQIISLALLGASCAGSFAQSSVTLFGVTDAYVRHVKTGSTSSTDLGSGGESTSRFGLRGIEDLGGGLKASFWLESQVNIDTGSTGATNFGVNRFFNRRSTVSLSGPWGELRAGRDTLPSWTALSNFEVFGTVGVGSSANLYTDAAVFGSQHRVRADNLLAYSLPSRGGVYGSVAFSPSEGGAAGRYRGARLGYRSGPLDVTVAYGDSEVGTAGNVKVTVLSGAYDFGFAKLSATVKESEYATAKHRFQYLAATKQLGVGTVKASYARTTGAGVLGTTNWSTRKADQIALGYVHNLSKRTALYTTLSYLKNRGSATYSVASIAGATTAAGDSSRGLDLGIRHSF